MIPSFRKLQDEARETSQRFLSVADEATTAGEAADWAAAAKSAIAVAVSCETVLKIQRGGKVVSPLLAIVLSAGVIAALAVLVGTCMDRMGKL